MAQTLIGLGGAWSTAANWAVCNSTAESDSEAVAGGTALTTSYVTSTTFTPGAITIDGIAVKVASRAASPTGTISVALDQGGSTVAGTEVTINVSDVDTALGWLLFKFTGVALSGATLYGVKAKTSSASQVNLYSTATTNWSRELRTTTTSASGPGAGDKLIVTNEKTSAGNQNAITQTVDSDLSATTVGNTAFPQSIHVSNGGKVAFSTVSGANPKIKVAGIVQVYGGTWNQGNSAGDPIPSNSIADLAFAVSVNVDSGIVFANGSTVNIYGVSRATTQCKLAVDFGGYAISDHTGVWVSLVQGGGNASAIGSGTWDTGVGLSNGSSVTFTSTTVFATTFAKTLAGASAIRDWSAASISAASNAAAASMTYSGSPAVTTGMVVYISGFTGNWVKCNGWQRVTVVDGTHFTLAINSTLFGAVTGTPVFSGSACNITVALAVDTAFGWLPATLNQVTMVNLDGSAPNLSDWASGDQIVVAGTGRIYQECESVTVSSANNTTKVVTLTGNLAAPHVSMNEVGLAAVRCEVINLTRNVKIHGASTSLQGYISVAATAVVNWQYAELYWLGSGTSNKRGIDIATTTGTFIATFCSLHDFVVTSSFGFNVTGTSGYTSSTFILQRNCFYGFDSQMINMVQPASAGTVLTCLIDNNIGMKMNVANTMFTVNNRQATVTNNTLIGNQSAAFLVGETVTQSASGTCDGNVAHSGSGDLCRLVSSGAGLTNTTVWRGSGNGMLLPQAQNATGTKSVSCIGLVAFGCNLNLVIGNIVDLLIQGAVINDDVVFKGGSTAAIFVAPNGVSANIQIENSTAGVVSDIRTNNMGADLTIANNNAYSTVFLKNCILSSQVDVSIGVMAGSTSALYIKNFFVTSARHNQQAGNHRFWTIWGQGSIDTTLFRTASPSLRLAPSSTLAKLESAPPAPYNMGVKAAVVNATSLTASVYIRRSVVGDGTAYNGNAPRLILRKNVALGIAADTVLATSSASAGTWEQLTATTAAATDDGVMEFIVDCDGTAGFVSICDWACTPPTDTKGGRYWFNGVPNVAGDNSAGGAGIIGC